jgi:ABC-type transport system involved in multi-copper enzyme maturation permease subunit
MGVTYSFGEKTLENWVSVVILLAAAVIFFALTILVYGKRKTK